MLKMNEIIFCFCIYFVIATLRKITTKRIKVLNGVISLFIVIAYGLYYIYNMVLLAFIKNGIINDSIYSLKLINMKDTYVSLLELIPIVFIIVIVIYNLKKSKNDKDNV